MAISATDARNLFTKKLIAVYKEKTTPTSFLRSFFSIDESLTKEVSIEVQRGTEKVAVDVLRGTDGNFNKMSKSTEKIFIPPFYRENIMANDHRLYDVAIGAQSAEVISVLASELADEVNILKAKIERAIEKQCADVFETGIITLNAGTNIDFKRKAASLVNTGAGTYWATGTVSPYDQMLEGANFLRQTGKSQGGVLNAIMGTIAFNDFLKNTIVKERADVLNFKLDMVNEPQKNSVGASLHGRVSVGSYLVNIWTYPEFYDDANGVSTPYVNPKKIIMLPENPEFKLAFGAVPQLLDGSMPKPGAFVVSEYFDQDKVFHKISVKSAAVAIPVAIDQIYTRQVVA